MYREVEDLLVLQRSENFLIFFPSVAIFLILDIVRRSRSAPF